MGFKILIVEDDLDLATMIDLVLRRAGYQTILCARGDTAFQVFKDSNPDLVLLDLMLPGRNGFDIAKEIRSESKIPIVMLTARTDSEDIIRGLEESGADDYIIKPCESQVLVARIKARLRVHDKHVVTLGDITMHPESRTAFRSGVEISLTKTEFDLLKHFAMNPDTAFTREVSLKDVWNYRGVDGSDTRLVNVHVQRLRSKIEEDPENPKYVLSVRGIGYKSGTPS
jgi:two-component system response regulator MtrA